MTPRPIAVPLAIKDAAVGDMVLVRIGKPCGGTFLTTDTGGTVTALLPGAVVYRPAWCAVYFDGYWNGRSAVQFSPDDATHDATSKGQLLVVVPAD